MSYMMFYPLASPSLNEMNGWFRRPASYDSSHLSRYLDILDPFGGAPMWREQEQPRTYRVTLDCQGYEDPKSIKTEIKDGKLVVTGSEEVHSENDEEYSVRKFRKTFALPENVETDQDKMASCLRPNGKLVVEVPLKEKKRESAFPRIVDGENGQKKVRFTLNLPKAIDPSQLSVTCKDGDVIVKGESKSRKEGDKKDEQEEEETPEIFYFQRTSLPENTKFNELKCSFENGQLSIEAPVEVKPDVKVPIEIKKSTESIKSK